jgi:proton glutamate symport protein
MTKKWSSATAILVAVAAGAVFGAVAPTWAVKLAIFGDIFLKLIQSVVAPLMFATLVVGVARAGGGKIMGRVGGKALLLFQVTASLSLVFGVVAAMIFRPGAGITITADAAAAPQNTTSLHDIFLSPFPSSIIDSLARGDILQIVVFALIFGFACSAVGPAAEPVVRFFESLGDIMFRYTDYVMLAAPIGIFGAMSAAIGTKGLGVLLSLGKLVFTLYGALIVFTLVVLGPVLWYSRVSLGRFFSLVREPFAIAFTTTSSNVALPVALERMKTMGVPQHIAALVLPFSMSFNTTGSNLFIALGTVFCAQAAGIELTMTQIGVLLLTLFLTTKGIGAVPRGSLVIIAGALTQFGIPLEGVAMILGVDQLMDMAAIARWEGVDLERAK